MNNHPQNELRNEIISELRILHVAAIPRPSSGIQQQLIFERDAAKELSLPWKTEVFIPPNIQRNNSEHLSVLSRLIAWFKHRSFVYSNLLSRVEEFDVLIFRYSVHDFFLLLFLIRCPKPVFLVHHTIETKELLLEGRLLGKIRFLAEKVIGKKVNRLASGQIAVTKEILEYVIETNGIPNFSWVYPNGIEISKEILTEQASAVPEFLFVSSTFHSWQGLDRLIASMNANTSDFKVHLVGELNHDQLSICKVDKRFEIHGSCNQTQIWQIAKNCSVGIGPLALDRKHLTQGSALKVREYLNMGLGVIADHEDVFPHNWPYYQQVPSTPEELVEEMLSFARTMKGVSKYEIQEQSVPYISKKYLVFALYSALVEHEKNFK